jgi:hypothetical protein
VDIAGTTVTGGAQIFALNIDNPNSTGLIDLDNYDFVIAPGETLTISGKSSNASELGAAINWSEDI